MDHRANDTFNDTVLPFSKNFSFLVSAVLTEEIVISFDVRGY